jgi:hypothetical protein
MQQPTIGVVAAATVMRRLIAYDKGWISNTAPGFQGTRKTELRFFQGLVRLDAVPFAASPLHGANRAGGCDYSTVKRTACSSTEFGPTMIWNSPGSTV